MAWNRPTKPKRPDANANQLVGNATQVRTRRGETWKQRHARRLEVALGMEDEMREFCHAHQIEFKTHNKGRYWRFILHAHDGGKWGNVAEWFPEDGNMKLGTGIKAKTIHTHDVPQVRKILTKAWNLESA